MLPQRGRGSGGAQLTLLEQVRRSRLHYALLVFPKRSSRGEVIDIGQSASVADGCHRHTQHCRQLDNFVYSPFSGPAVDDILNEIKMFHPMMPIEVGAIFGHFLLADHGAEVDPLLTRDRAKPHPAVLGRLDRRKIDTPRQSTLGPLAVQVVINRHRQHQGFETRHVNVLTCASLSGRKPCAQSPHRSVGSDHPFAESPSRCHRLATGKASVIRRADRSLQRKFAAGPVAPGTSLAKGSDRNQREPRVALLKNSERKPKFIQGTGCKTFDQEVRRRRQVEQGRPALHRIEINDDTALRSVQKFEQGAVVASGEFSSRR